MEGSTPAAEVDGCKKRPLELGRPAFMAREGGAYHVLEMPKKYKCDPARSNSAFTNALDAEDARLLAMCFRETSVTNKYRQELQAMAAARRTQLI